MGAGQDSGTPGTNRSAPLAGRQTLRGINYLLSGAKLHQASLCHTGREHMRETGDAT